MAKYPGRKMQLSRNTVSTTYVVVGQVLELGLAGSSRNLIDASAYGDDWMDYVVGQQDGTEVTVRVAFDPGNAQHTALYSDYLAGVQKNFQITNTAATPSRTLTFPSYITAYSEGGTLGGV